MEDCKMHSSMGLDGNEHQEEDKKAPRAEDFGGTTLPEDRHGVIIHGWRIESVKKPILNSPELEKWDKDLGAFRLPEMVFGHSSLEIEHLQSGTTIAFNAFDALKEWKEAKLPPVKVPAAAAWQAREKLSQEVLLDYDYTFTSPYKGSLSSTNGDRARVTGAWATASSTAGQDLQQLPGGTPTGSPPPARPQWVESDQAQIDWELLKRRDPILFFDEIILYEDELADSGTAQLSVRTRVMPQSWFTLLRFWLRVDGSLMRAYETRLFCRFTGSLGSGALPTGNTEVVREYCEREDTFQALASRGFPEAASEYKQPDTVVQRLQLKQRKCAMLNFA